MYQIQNFFDNNYCSFFKNVLQSESKITKGKKFITIQETIKF